MRPIFPEEFDCRWYRERHTDLSAFSDVQLRDHYERHGRQEGRAASPTAFRAEFIKLVPQNGRLLEIGPSSKPVFRGGHVSYFDVKQAAGEEAPPITYVEPSGDLAIVPSGFGAVFSSHCIEHQPDLAYHLQQVGRVLAPGGAYFLLIPNKLYCFDHFIPPSTIAGVAVAHHERRKRHTLRSVIEHRALTTHNDPARHWNSDHADADYQASIIWRVRASMIEYEQAAGAYIDVHAWQFTPQSFRELMSLMFETGLSPLKPLRVYDSPRGSNEFAAILAPA
jgi:SAM-dependent methyltransferase